MKPWNLSFKLKSNTEKYGSILLKTQLFENSGDFAWNLASFSRISGTFSWITSCFKSFARYFASIYLAGGQHGVHLVVRPLPWGRGRSCQLHELLLLQKLLVQLVLILVLLALVVRWHVSWIVELGRTPLMLLMMGIVSVASSVTIATVPWGKGGGRSASSRALHFETRRALPTWFFLKIQTIHLHTEKLAIASKLGLKRCLLNTFASFWSLRCVFHAQKIGLKANF